MTTLEIPTILLWVFGFLVGSGAVTWLGHTLQLLVALGEWGQRHLPLCRVGVHSYGLMQVDHLSALGARVHASRCRRCGRVE